MVGLEVLRYFSCATTRRTDSFPHLPPPPHLCRLLNLCSACLRATPVVATHVSGWPSPQEADAAGASPVDNDADIEKQIVNAGHSATFKASTEPKPQVSSS